MEVSGHGVVKAAIFLLSNKCLCKCCLEPAGNIVCPGWLPATLLPQHHHQDLSPIVIHEAQPRSCTLLTSVIGHGNYRSPIRISISRNHTWNCCGTRAGISNGDTTGRGSAPLHFDKRTKDAKKIWSAFGQKSQLSEKCKRIDTTRPSRIPSISTMD